MHDWDRWDRIISQPWLHGNCPESLSSRASTPDLPYCASIHNRSIPSLAAFHDRTGAFQRKDPRSGGVHTVQGLPHDSYSAIHALDFWISPDASGARHHFDQHPVCIGFLHIVTKVHGQVQHVSQPPNPSTQLRIELWKSVHQQQYVLSAPRLLA